MINKDDLLKFTEEIASLYQEGKINAPIHLNGGEDQLEALMSIFQDI